jgi:hypothetical protein
MVFKTGITVDCVFHHNNLGTGMKVTMKRIQNIPLCIVTKPSVVEGLDLSHRSRFMKVSQPNHEVVARSTSSMVVDRRAGMLVVAFRPGQLLQGLATTCENPMWLDCRRCWQLLASLCVFLLWCRRLAHVQRQFSPFV